MCRRSFLLGSAALGLGLAKMGRASGNLAALTLTVQEVDGIATYNGVSPGPLIDINPGDAF